MGNMFCFLSYFQGIPQKSMVYRPIPHVTATVTTAWRSCWPKWRQEPGFSTKMLPSGKIYSDIETWNTVHLDVNMYVYNDT